LKGRHRLLWMEVTPSEIEAEIELDHDPRGSALED
jgi:hypothetical protein